MCSEDNRLEPWSKETYNLLKSDLESKGFVVLTKWRKGLRHMKLGGNELLERRK